MKFALGLRRKVILISSFFLILPWLGYQTILEMENFLRQGQEQALLSTTQAVATALHERPTLFNMQASLSTHIEAGKDLYAYKLKTPIKIDGKLADWQQDVSKSFVYAKQQTRYQLDTNSNNPISFRHMIALQGKHLYAYLQVTDKHPTFRNKNSRFLDKNDHLIIALSTPENRFQRYIVSVTKSGWFNGYLLADERHDTKKVVDHKRDKRIQGYWQVTATGYNIELRLPANMLGDKLGFSLHTSSNSETGEIDNIIATSNSNNLQQLGTILVPSPEIGQILSGLSHSQSRLWVIDRHQRVLATAGDIHQAGGLWENNQPLTTKLSWWESLQGQLFKPVYNLFLNQPDNSFIDELAGKTQLNSEFIKQAFSGKSQSNSRKTNDNKATILSAASPIFVDDQVMGMVVAEETTNGIQLLRNQALEKLFNILIAVLFIGTLLLFSFTASVVSRLGKLRDQAENAIDEQGRLCAPFIADTSSDEIGELSRSLSDMVKRLGQYHQYLENLAARLSHELATPVAVVRSSLENLALLPQDAESQKYIQRSQTGITRLKRILTNMSEATRLEQSLQHGEKIRLSLNEFLTSCVQGYQMTYSEQQFLLNCSVQKVSINADPDFMVQCIDKLINNAIEFSKANMPIKLTLSHNAQFVFIDVENSGPLLPESMSDDLLNSMVSVRQHNNTEKTHLGLGLFIAKMICDFHQGYISISNNETNSGVNVRLRFPRI